MVPTNAITGALPHTSSTPPTSAGGPTVTVTENPQATVTVTQGPQTNFCKRALNLIVNLIVSTSLTTSVGTTIGANQQPTVFTTTLGVVVPANGNSGSSSSDKIAIGLGIGVGLPATIAGLLIFWWEFKKRGWSLC
jgi:hypothetical protein